VYQLPEEEGARLELQRYHLSLLYSRCGEQLLRQRTKQRPIEKMLSRSGVVACSARRLRFAA
jgi:hypothetical protein